MGHQASYHPVRTPDDLIEAATVGARLATRVAAARCEDEEATRREVIDRFRKDMEAESYGPFADERLMSAAQAAVESVLDELRNNHRLPRSDGRITVRRR